MGKSINSVESVPMAEKTKQFTATYGTASDEEDVRKSKKECGKLYFFFQGQQLHRVVAHLVLLLVGVPHPPPVYLGLYQGHQLIKIIVIFVLLFHGMYQLYLCLNEKSKYFCLIFTCGTIY